MSMTGGLISNAEFLALCAGEAAGDEMQSPLTPALSPPGERELGTADAAGKRYAVAAGKRYAVARERVCCWRPVGGQVFGTVRSMPDPLPDLGQELARLLAMPVDEFAIGQPGGHDYSKPKIGCAELYVAMIQTQWRVHWQWSRSLIRELVRAGKRVVIYDGAPRTDADEAMLSYLMRTMPDGVMYCMDEAGSLGPDSLAYRLAERLGGPERFAIEATPKRANAGTWDGYRVIQLAREMLYVERHPDEFVDLAAHPSVGVMMTGHTLREIGRAATPRDAVRWLRDYPNLVLGWEPWRNAMYAGRVLDVRGAHGAEG